MKKIAFVLFAMLSVVATAQTTLNGITEEYNGRASHTPLGGVELRVRDASSSVSDEKGRFTLNFLTSKPGDRVIIRDIDNDIQKEGYEVFNKEALQQWYLSNTKERFTIVLCKSSVFKALKDKWNKQSSESYARQYRKDQDELKRQLDEGKMQVEEYQRKMLALEDQYYEQLKNLDNYIDKFARIDLSKMTEYDSTLVTMLEQGKIDEVIRIYEEQKNVEKYLTAKSENRELDEATRKIEKKRAENRQIMATAKEKIVQQIQAYYLVGGRENIMKIDSIYRELATRDSLDCNAQFEYSAFLHKQNRSTQAAEMCKKALKCPNLTKIMEIEVYDLLATILIYSGKSEEGLRYAQTSIDSLSKYLDTDSVIYIEKYLSGMAHAAVALNFLGRNEESLAMNERVIELCERLMDKKLGEDYTMINDLYVTTSINTMSYLTYYNSEFEKAMRISKSLLKRADEINQKYKMEMTLENLAKAQRVSGDLCMRLNMMSEADSLLKLSVLNMRRLCRKNKEKYVNELSSSLENLGMMQFMAGQLEESKKSLEESLILSRENCNMDNSQNVEVLTLALNNVGYLLYVLRDLEASERYLNEAMEYSEKLIKSSHEAYSMVYATSAINLFTTYLAEEKIEQCQAMLAKTVEMAEYVYRQRGASYAMSYLMLKMEMARYYVKRNEIDKAKGEVVQAQGIDPTCFEADPGLAELLKEKGLIK